MTNDLLFVLLVLCNAAVCGGVFYFLREHITHSIDVAIEKLKESESSNTYRLKIEAAANADILAAHVFGEAKALRTHVTGYFDKHAANLDKTVLGIKEHAQAVLDHTAQKAVHSRLVREVCSVCHRVVVKFDNATGAVICHDCSSHKAR